MKKIVIIGANSYIARNIIYVLMQSPELYELSLYDNKECQIDNLENYKSINILSKDAVKNISFECDVIFMFIGKTGSADGFDNPDVFIDINERALLNVLNEYRVQKSAAKIIFPSTRLVFKGKHGKLKEDAEKEFKTIYAINKYACEQYIEMYSRVYGVQYCIFRICIPYGTLIPNASSYGTAEFMLSKATKGENITLYGDGGVRRTLTYMGDLCNKLIVGGLSEKCVNDVFNIGGEDYSLLEMATMIAGKYGIEIEFIPWPEVALKIESGDTVFDSDKLDLILKIKDKKCFKEWCLSR
ncbi:NAD(P)-dependent oxidoreductase [Clostridium sp.]|uniref:NAD-dependent epimerase/dehydratase family protein n=1 Tax=Clostridium sp. TaxID=1506 RepID=UPI001A447F66|nr:NAD(P)-dependent oxidoreductase [Clostridium sp.]MBK5241009.1 NAD(P)-dependent oxidoreductase [Clostridium sp.]